jgi:hypothetical protein
MSTEASSSLVETIWLRLAAVRKFMVGFDLLGSAQHDITPASAADTLGKTVNL